MTNQEKVEYLLGKIKELKEDIAVLQNNIEEAENYLDITPSEEIDFKLFNNEFDIEKGLKHIELF